MHVKKWKQEKLRRPWASWTFHSDPLPPTTSQILHKVKARAIILSTTPRDRDDVLLPDISISEMNLAAKHRFVFLLSSELR